MSIRNLFPQFIAVIAALAIPAGAAENGGAALREFLTAFFQPPPRIYAENPDFVTLRTLPDGKPFLFKPDAFRPDKRYLVLEIRSARPGTGLILFQSGKRRFRVPGDNAWHVCNIDLYKDGRAAGLGAAVNIRFLDLPGQEFGLRRFRLSPVPEGPADLEIRSAGLTETFNYPGEEREFFIHVRNHGGTAATGLAVARLAFPPGVTVLSGGAGEKFPDVPPCGFATHTVKVKAGRPLKGVFRLQLSGAGAPREAFRGPVEFDRNPQLPKAGYVPEPRPVNTRYEIGAFYFPGWETGKRWNQIRTAAPERKPLLGYYDETSPEVVDWQIKWLVENGFSFLLVDWYWNRGSRSHEHWVRAFDRARYNKYLKWAVMWANHTPPGSHSVEDQRAVTRYWIDNYFNKPYYYRIDGRPVVVIWQPGNMRRDLGPHGTHKLLHISQEMAKEAGLPGICFIAMKWPEAAVDAQAIETLKADGFSMTSIYHYMGTGDRTPANPARYDFSLVAESSPEFWNRNHKAGVLPFLPNLSTGWNDFPWHFYGGTAVENRTPELFREICRDARRFADRTGIRRLVLAPLNEWGEGSYAEPNREYKFKMYEAVRDAFATPPSGGWPLNYGPEAVGLGPYPLDPAAP
ncbi:glycoside hydrolase family 99-like domain-containing protein [Victivallis lenta]|uniref:glycoside hydrolase family 99-like domain-containing protein n=2 Tax=Victivallis lenta TaxID=2606640 RepID=UPI003AB7C8D9